MKKLVLVLATFMSVIGARNAQKVKVLNRICCIYCLVQFRKDKGKNVLALLNFGVNSQPSANY